ncbi:hypothetical protein FJZ39_04195 [Candidatus Saccharibacteria bacterium]|nr:hypothetical protein [Candidatus Saccharibacteria bacterium]
MKKTYVYGLLLGVATAAYLAVSTGSIAGAMDIYGPCSGNSDSTICRASSDEASSITLPLINTLLFIVGLVAVIMIILSGIKYATSGGDSGKTAAAKNTLLYSIVGLIVAIFAYAIVRFVVQAF